MKKYLLVLTMFLIFMASCTYKESSSDKMRRFVFVSMDTTLHVDITGISKENEAHDLLTKNGFVNVGTYTSGSIHLVIVDMEAEFDLVACRNVLNNLSSKSSEFLPLAQIVNGKYELINRI